MSGSVIVITGMSGAGRSLAAKALEDLGRFVVDNVPAEMVGVVVEQAMAPSRGRDQVAVVVDARSGLGFEPLHDELASLRGRGVETTILFLDADDDVVATRFEESRRPHPVPAPNLAASIAQERRALEEIRAQAQVVIDTSTTTVHELRAQVQATFADSRRDRPLRVSVQSFGFKHGVPRVLDLLFDVRFLPNPHWIDELRPLTGLDSRVSDHVLGSPDAAEFVHKIEDLLDFLIPRYATEGKSYLTIGIGCTGGRHRSVAIAEALGEWLEERGDVDTSVIHRDTER